jgi:AcrR family transcriptional regulator
MSTTTAPRRLPRQERAQATVLAVLEATAALLTEVGYEGVNTNAVAARAGVKPPAVYRYFPNKFALYLALAEKLQGELDAVMDVALNDMDARPLGAVIDRLINGAAAFWLKRPAFAALWYGEWSIQGSPSPAVFFGERTVARFAAATKRFRHLGPVRERIVLAAAMQIGMVLVNLASLAPQNERTFLIAEAKRAVLAYLAPIEQV